MIVRRIAMVAGVALALVGCGEDGNDGLSSGAGGGFFDKGAPAEGEPGIVVIAAPGAGHDGDHDEASDDQATSDSEGIRDDGEMVDHDDDGATPESDGMADGADHLTGSELAEDEADHESVEPDHAEDEGRHDFADDGALAAAASDGVVSSDEAAGIVVEVEMVEFGYVLDRESVPVGEPVTFRFANSGQIEHEAMFGSAHQQEEFAATEGHGDHGSEGHHGDIAALTLDATADGEIVMVFDSPGEVMIGCHLPGHWEAGMSTSFNVLSA